MSIYHYTDINALLGIVGNTRGDSAIWLTNAEYMNDAMEFRTGMDYVENIITKSMGSVGAALEIAEASRSIMANMCFIGSFSLKNDQLSQWRGYCPNGGVCIEFDGDKIDNLLSIQEEHARLWACLYHRHEEQINIIGDKFEEAAIFAKQKLDGVSEGNVKEQRAEIIADLIHELSSYLFAVLPILKDSSFHEESEVRIIMHNMVFSDVKFRSKGGYLIPYIELKGNEDISVRDCITKITIGPGASSEKCKNSIEYFLRSKGMEIDVVHSLIPLTS